jgi:hypothetical protein
MANADISFLNFAHASGHAAICPRANNEQRTMLSFLSPQIVSLAHLNPPR